MNKKITGVETDGNKVRDSLRSAREFHDQYVLHFNNKKLEHADIKAENEIARGEIKKEQRLA
jgi:hypothetical protein